MNSLAKRMKHNRDKGISEHDSWYKLPVYIYIPEVDETYAHYISRIYSERPNAPNDLGEDAWEVHHIVPKCMGGDGTGIIWLMLREHYWAHLLLCKENPGNLSLINACRLLMYRQKNGVIDLNDLNYINSETEKLYKINNVTLGSEILKNLEPLDL